MKTELLIMIATSSLTVNAVLAYQKLKRSIKQAETTVSYVPPTPPVRPVGYRSPVGLIDYKTGRRVDIDPVSGREIFVD